MPVWIKVLSHAAGAPLLNYLTLGAPVGDMICSPDTAEPERRLTLIRQF